MNIQISAAWEKVQGMINGFIALLPNLILALVVFAIFSFTIRLKKLMVIELDSKKDGPQVIAMQCLSQTALEYQSSN
jgi:hypothetical protein